MKKLIAIALLLAAGCAPSPDAFIAKVPQAARTVELARPACLAAIPPGLKAAGWKDGDDSEKHNAIRASLPDCKALDARIDDLRKAIIAACDAIKSMPVSSVTGHQVAFVRDNCAS